MKSDLIFGIRSLVKDKSFTCAAVLSLALGIGANTAIFTLVNAVFLRPLPVEEPSKLVAAYWIDNGTSRTTPSSVRNPFAYENYQDIRARNQVFTDIAAFRNLDATLRRSDGAPEPQNTALVSANYFEVLGVKPILGRTFLPTEDRTPGADRVMVLSYVHWQSKFGGSTSALGQTVSLNSEPYTVVGVMPAGFKGTLLLQPADQVWIPVSMWSHIMAPPTNDLFYRRYRHVLLIGRRKPGIEVAQAEEVLRGIAKQLEHEYPWHNPGASADVIPLSEATLGTLSRDAASLAAITLLAVAGLILLIACLNVAGLLVTRAAGRTREVGIRSALGAGRARLVRQFLSESLLLALLGGAIGLLLGWAGSRLLWSLRPASLAADTLTLRLDARVYLFTAGIAILSTLLFGLAPALSSLHPNLLELMNSGGRDRALSGQTFRRTMSRLPIWTPCESGYRAGVF